jgi:hypothetical protein
MSIRIEYRCMNPGRLRLAAVHDPNINNVRSFTLHPNAAILFYRPVKSPH